MRMMLIFTCLIALLLAFGCSKQSEEKRAEDKTPSTAIALQSITPPTTTLLFNQTLQSHLFEFPAQALTVWRTYRPYRPTLVILADEPCLNAVPDLLVPDVLELIRVGADKDLRRRADFYQADPLLPGPQAVRAALLAGIFSDVVWLLPDQRPLKEFSFEVMEKQLHEAGYLVAGEKLQKTAPGILTFRIEGVPVNVVHPDAWENYKISNPVVLHFDLSYFKSIYHNEIRTPVYPLLTTLATMLRQAKLNVLAATLSYSTNDFYVGLEGRFTLRVFEKLMLQPKLLDENLSEAWRLHGKALYSQNMYLESDVTALYDKLISEYPNDPAFLYAAAQRRFYSKKFAEGMALLDRAVAVDAGYGVTYIHLADKAEAAKDLKNCRVLLERAALAAPDNPFITLRRADLLLRMDEKEAAGELLDALERLPWSMLYHKQVPKLIQELRGR